MIIKQYQNRQTYKRIFEIILRFKSKLCKIGSFRMTVKRMRTQDENKGCAKNTRSLKTQCSHGLAEYWKCVPTLLQSNYCAKGPLFKLLKKTLTVIY